MSSYVTTCRNCDEELEYNVEGPQRGGPETEPLAAFAYFEGLGTKCPKCGEPVPDSDTILKELAEDAADRYIDDRDDWDYDN